MEEGMKMTKMIMYNSNSSSCEDEDSNSDESFYTLPSSSSDDAYTAKW